jgi:GDP-L-fucose synthase
MTPPRSSSSAVRSSRVFKRILVSGGTGLLGTALRAIAADYPDREFTFFGSHACDLTKLDETLAFVGRQKPDAILHTAALAGGIQYSQKHPATLLRDNVLMNLNVLEAARRLGVGKTVMSLSSGMYPAAAPNPIKEEYAHDGSPHESNYGYSFAKRLIDPSIKAYRTEYGLSAIGLVPNGIFGENGNYRPEESVMLAALIRRFHEQRDGVDPIVIWGDGSPLREYTYSQDMARAYMWCLDHYDAPQILNVGSTEEHSVKETAFMIADIMGIDTGRIQFDVTKPKGIARKSTDNSTFVQLSAFTYTPFREGLVRTIEWFVENYAVPDRVRL